MGDLHFLPGKPDADSVIIVQGGGKRRAENRE
jgi:hypothetical protein